MDVLEALRAARGEIASLSRGRGGVALGMLPGSGAGTGLLGARPPITEAAGMSALSPIPTVAASQMLSTPSGIEAYSPAAPTSPQDAAVFHARTGSLEAVLARGSLAANGKWDSEAYLDTVLQRARNGGHGGGEGAVVLRAAQGLEVEQNEDREENILGWEVRTPLFASPVRTRTQRGFVREMEREQVRDRQQDQVREREMQAETEKREDRERKDKREREAGAERRENLERARKNEEKHHGHPVQAVFARKESEGEKEQICLPGKGHVEGGKDWQPESQRLTELLSVAQERSEMEHATLLREQEEREMEGAKEREKREESEQQVLQLKAELAAVTQKLKFQENESHRLGQEISRMQVRVWFSVLIYLNICTERARERTPEGESFYPPLTSTANSHTEPDFGICTRRSGENSPRRTCRGSKHSSQRQE